VANIAKTGQKFPYAETSGEVEYFDGFKMDARPKWRKSMLEYIFLTYPKDMAELQ
jgi:hypothetical protein